jgi:glycosyltransferase involved in cell wall biosynthesis
VRRLRAGGDIAVSNGYAIVTPAHDESDHLERLVSSVAAQTVLPRTWVIVENASTDDTPRLIADAARWHGWIEPTQCTTTPGRERGAPIVQALSAGLEALEPFPDVVVQLDADLTMPPDYFERLLAALDESERLGIVSGTCFELERGAWKEQLVTPPHVWGAARAYRRECLLDVLPFEPRTGWDAVDVAQANAVGWQTAIIPGLPFYHHRREASRERGRWSGWSDQGRTSHFLGYRPSYIALRAGYRAVSDPAALGLLAGYVSAAVTRRSRCSRPNVVEWVRSEQRLRTVARRGTEAVRRGKAPRPRRP